MFGGQQSPDVRLEMILEKHFQSRWLQPLHAPTVSAFHRAVRLADPQSLHGKLILDSGCGTGESTRIIAKREPESLVIGIDRSAHRLNKTGHVKFPCREGNIIWVRAELETFWRLAGAQGWNLYRHFLLYPNPYPKASHLKKRWHAHPVFPAIIGLGGELELRSNWQIYALEFAHALGFVCAIGVGVELLNIEQALSPFERKYAASGHPLYRVKVPAGVLSNAMCQTRFAKRD